MKTFENYYNESFEIEKSFLKFSNFYELEIKFNLIEYEEDMFYMYDNKCIFDQDKVGRNFWINKNILKKISTDMSLSYNDTIEMLYHTIEKYFNIEKYLITDGTFSVDV